MVARESSSYVILAPYKYHSPNLKYLQLRYRLAFGVGLFKEGIVPAYELKTVELG